MCLDNEKIKLNLGCGLYAPQGWVNIDSSLTARLSKLGWFYRLICKVCNTEQVSWPSNVTVLDVRKGLPFPDGSVSAIYTSHMLEHMSYKAANFVIKECFRLLGNGGMIRIVVPDLYEITKNYINLIERTPAEEYSYDCLRSLSFYQDEPVRWRSLRKILGNSRHLYMYDFWSLKAILERNSFGGIQKMDYRQSQLRDIELLENRGHCSLYLEAIKY